MPSVRFCSKVYLCQINFCSDFAKHNKPLLEWKTKSIRVQGTHKCTYMPSEGPHPWKSCFGIIYIK